MWLFARLCPRAFDYCEGPYFAEMERINRELKLDRDVQVASPSPVGGRASSDHHARWRRYRLAASTSAMAHISSASFLSKRRGNGAASAPRLCIASSSRQCTPGGPDARRREIKPAKRLYDRLGFHVTHEDEREILYAASARHRRAEIELIRARLSPERIRLDPVACDPKATLAAVH